LALWRLDVAATTAGGRSLATAIVGLTWLWEIAWLFESAIFDGEA